MSHWNLGEFGLYRVNPPLGTHDRGYSRSGRRFPDGLASTPSRSARTDFAVGDDFVAANGEGSFFSGLRVWRVYRSSGSALLYASCGAGTFSAGDRFPRYGIVVLFAEHARSRFTHYA